MLTSLEGTPRVTLWKANQRRGISRTVYEVLDTLIEAGLASRVSDEGDPSRYEADSGPHYHARCRRCERLDDVPAGADDLLRKRLALPEDFQLEKIKVTFEGLCSQCQGKIEPV